MLNYRKIREIEDNYKLISEFRPFIIAHQCTSFVICMDVMIIHDEMTVRNIRIFLLKGRIPTYLKKKKRIS